jgi:predicted aspartyl protease
MQTSHETWVTFRLAGSKQALISVPVFVDGRGPYSFVMDTGATSTVVSNEMADALALPRGEEPDVFRPEPLFHLIQELASKR